MEIEFNNTIQNIIKILNLSEDMTQIQDRDCVAYEITKNNILLKPEGKYNVNNSLYPTFTNALRVVKLPKGTIIEKNPLYKYIKCSGQEYLTHRLSPYTSVERILIQNTDSYAMIISNKEVAIKMVKEPDYSN